MLEILKNKKIKIKTLNLIKFESSNMCINILERLDP